MRKVFKKIKEEIEAVIPPTIFFFVALHVIALERSLLTRGTGIGPISHVKITIAALLLGKAVLIADHLPMINRYPRKPLIFNVAWKTAIYMIVASVIHYLENLVDFWRTTGGFTAANRKLWDQIVWAHFLGIQILLFILVWSYCTMHELARVAGREKILEIFFGIRPKPRAGDSVAQPVANMR